MKHTKQALFHSIVALILCCSMLVGTTFAWFTDEVTSGVNKIQAGNLDIELEYLDGGDWKPVKSDKSVFPEGILWEPGHTEVVYLRIVNKGNLALKYQLGIGVEGETLSVTESGEVIQLSKYIHFGAVDGVSVPFADRDAARAAVTESKALTAGYTKTGTMTATNETAYMALVVYMPESVGNEANHATGADAPSINMGIRLLATQLNSEMDSFGSDYDKDSLYPGGVIDFAVMAPVAADASGAVAAETTVGEEGKIHAKVPAGAQLIDPDAGLGLEIVTKNGTDSNIQAKAGQTMKPMDIKMPNLSPDNQELIKVTIPGLLKKGLNSTSVQMYHVEGNETKEMTQVALADLDAHNEFYYDPATGDVTICTKSFSEYVTVANATNEWDGKTANAYSGTGTKDDPYLISTAEQLAYFRNQVDSGNTFQGQYVKLATDIDLWKKNFDPIGWGYDYKEYNLKDAQGNRIPGKVFKGTFDGGNYTIRNLYQSGWDLETDTKTDYTYTNCGFGLFASACDATFKNLTISGADIRVECVEAGILVGLSQGACKYENINIYKSSIANYQRPAGGVVGEVSPKYVNGNAAADTQNFKNINVGAAVVVGSLWGDFDTPVGGVIGARWDDSNVTKIQMENVTVSCQLDVYSDVTAAYQWYAYRRAGMLIGNTDTPPADGKNAKEATAPFLICVEDQNTGTNTVKVYLGSWNDYHYCRFTNIENGGRSYPWVRVEEGRNNPAYSNPRYGHPTDANGKQVTDANHAHGDEDQITECHNVSIPFNQLYGGGQGVYGVSTHKNAEGYNDETDVDVITYDYTVTYLYRGQVFKVDYVKKNEAYKIKDTGEYLPIRAEQVKFAGWVDVVGNPADNPEIGNTENIVVYDSWVGIYTARFVDQFGNLVDEVEFVENTSTAEIKVPAVPQIEGFTGMWEEGWQEKIQTAKSDVVIKPNYVYSGDLTLIPVDNEPQDGITDYYYVAPNNKVDDNRVVIPGYVNGIPVERVQRVHNEQGGRDWGNQNENIYVIEVQEGVKTIDNNGLAYTPKLNVVYLPSTIESLGKNAFCRNGGGDDDKLLTIYYNGSGADWKNVMNNSTESTGILRADLWYGGLKKGTTVECTDGVYTLTKAGGLMSKGTWTFTPKA